MKDDTNHMDGITRRDFIKKSAVTAVGLSALPLIGSKALAEIGAAAGPAGNVRVCLIQSKTPIPAGSAAKSVFDRMLDEGIKYVYGQENPKLFWKSTFSKKDRVAIKVNNFGFRGNRGPQLAEAICDKMKLFAGVKPENIVVYENSDGALRNGGYRINHDGPGYRCYGTDHVGHMEKPIRSGACNANYTKILDQCTALVNMPTLKAHNMAGVTISLKNHYGSFDNPRQYHGNDCDPFIADINAADIIRKKNRLVVCDAVKVLFAGGPEWYPQWTVDYDGILVSTDPVAMDAIGYSIIQELRKKSGLKQLPYNPKPKQIKSAAKNGLGVADLSKIDFKRITV